MFYFIFYHFYFIISSQIYNLLYYLTKKINLRKTQNPELKTKLIKYCSSVVVMVSTK
jgi:hypothetical protein